MSTRSLSVVTMFFFATTPLHSQNLSKLSLDTLTSNIDAHSKMYKQNKLAFGTSKIYKIEGHDGKYTSELLDDKDFELVCDGSGNERFTIVTSRANQKTVNGSSCNTGTIRNSVSNAGGKYAIGDFISRANNQLRFLSATSQGIDSMASSFDGKRSIAIAVHYSKDSSESSHTFKIDTPTLTTHNGKQVVAVSSLMTPKQQISNRGGGPIRQTSYFDPANSFVYLGSESSEPATKERPWARVTTCALEYEARPGTYPIPKRFTRYVQPDKGEKMLEYEAVYTRFEDYAPNADDFRLEKRYGLTTPAGPDWKSTPESQAVRSNRGYYWAALLVVSVALGAIFYLRHRRNRVK